MKYSPSHSSRCTVAVPDCAHAILRLPRNAGRALIWIYRHTLSPLVGYNCRHLPTCSVYGDEAIERFGLWGGGWMTLARLLRCQPWGTSGIDNVPLTKPPGAHGICRGATAAGAASTRRSAIILSFCSASNAKAHCGRAGELWRHGGIGLLRPQRGHQQCAGKSAVTVTTPDRSIYWPCVALLIVIIAAYLYFTHSPQAPNTTAFIVPSQKRAVVKGFVATDSGRGETSQTS